MSTRSVIARIGQSEGEFSGVYHHWNGMPTSLGKFLFRLRTGYFKGDLSKMLNVLIDQHNGWSNIVDADFRLRPGYSNDLKKKNPACYCHGERSEKNERFTHADVVKGETDIEWVYVFDEERNRLFVRDISHDAESLIELSEPEPDWAVVECGEHFERCSHYAWFHDLLPKTSNLSTQAWLGNRPLEFRDAVAFIIGGKRYVATGSGGNADYLGRTSGKSHPRNSWVATVKAKNGKRLDLPVAVIAGEECKPFPGVVWIMPPTKINPQETVVSA
jgi:hypothetical protein